MSLLDLFRGGKKSPEKPADVPIDRSESGEMLYSDEIVSKIMQELERRRGERSAYELKWTLNANFLAGHQNCDIDPAANTIILEKPVERRDRERRVYNRIAPLMETRDANLGSVKYDMVVNPRTNEPEDIAKAKVSSALLQNIQSVVDFQHKITQVRRWMEVCGTAFALSWWDKDAGTVIAREVSEVVSPDGVAAQSFRDIHEGDISLGLLTAYEVFPHSLVVEDIHDQHDVIVEQVLDVGEIYDRYGIKVDGEQVDTYTMTPLPGAVTGHARANTSFGVEKVSREDCARVVTYFENPSKAHPRGRLIIIVKDTIVYYGELPAGIMPIQAFKAKPQAGMFFGKSVIEDLIPYQRTYNNVKNKIVDYIATVADNPWLMPAGSTDIEAVEANGIEAGAVLVYKPERGKPEIVQYPEPPSVIIAERDKLEQDMEYAAGVSQLMVYGAAASTSSGKALDTRREIDLTRMSMTADNLRDGVVGVAKIWLALNKEYSTGYRAMRIAGRDDLASVYVWSSEDINSYDVEFAAENELRHSREQQKQEFVEAYQLGLFTDEKGRISQETKQRAWKLFRLGSLDDVMEIDDIQRKNAERENVYLESGVIPNRFKYDDDAIHLDAHIRYALSTDFRMLMKSSPEYAALFDRHIEEHRAAIQQKQQAAQMQALAMQSSAVGQINQSSKNKGGTTK